MSRAQENSCFVVYFKFELLFFVSLYFSILLNVIVFLILGGERHDWDAKICSVGSGGNLFSLATSSTTALEMTESPVAIGGIFFCNGRHAIFL